MSTAVSESLRVVLDTNVLVSAFTHPQGLSFQIWQMAIQRRFRLLLSPQIVTELARVLRTKFSWGDARIQPEMKFLTRTAEMSFPSRRCKLSQKTMTTTGFWNAPSRGTPA